MALMSEIYIHISALSSSQEAAFSPEQLPFPSRPAAADGSANALLLQDWEAGWCEEPDGLG